MTWLKNPANRLPGSSESAVAVSRRCSATAVTFAIFLLCDFELNLSSKSLYPNPCKSFVPAICHPGVAGKNVKSDTFFLQFVDNVVLLGVISPQSFRFTHFYNDKFWCVEQKALLKTVFPCWKVFGFHEVDLIKVVLFPCFGKGACVFSKFHPLSFIGYSLRVFYCPGVCVAEKSEDVFCVTPVCRIKKYKWNGAGGEL